MVRSLLFRGFLGVVAGLTKSSCEVCGGACLKEEAQRVVQRLRRGGGFVGSSGVLLTAVLRCHDSGSSSPSIALCACHTTSLSVVLVKSQ